MRKKIFKYIQHISYKMNINEQMLSKFKHFINDLIKVFPEHEECINKNYTENNENDALMVGSRKKESYVVNKTG